MPADTPQGEEQPLMLSFAEAAERLVKDRIAPNMTAEGLRRLARDPHSGWPIGPKDYRVVGKTRTLPYDLLAPYMRERLDKRPGRGPNKTKKGTRNVSDPKTVTISTPMPNARARALAALVYREGGHLEITLEEMLAAPDRLLVTSTERGSIILRDPAAHEWDGQGGEESQAE
jgi:hypothetical protein